MADKRIDSVAFEEAIKEIASKMPKSIGDVGGVSWNDVKGRPIRVSDLPNDVKYQTEAQVNATVKKVVGNAPDALDTLEEIAERLKEDGDAMSAINSILNDKANRSEIPTNVSALNNDSGFLTSVSWSGIGDKPKTIAGYGITDAKIVNGVITIGNQSITPLTSHQSLSGYAKTTDIPTKTSQLTNDSGYLTVNTKDGVVEVGRYFDFHTVNYFGKDGKPDEDYTVRIDGGTSTDKRVFTFPSAGGTFATESFVKNNDVTKSISYRLGDGVSATSGNKRWIRIAKATDANASALINLCNSYFDENSDCFLLYVNKGYNVGDANSVIQQLGGRGGTKIFTKARWVVKSHTEEAYLEVYYDCTSGRNTLLINATNVHKMEFYTTPTDGEIPSGYRVVSEIDLTKGIVSDSFKKIGGTSSQFLKADGSVDDTDFIASDTIRKYPVPYASSIASFARASKYLNSVYLSNDLEDSDAKSYFIISNSDSKAVNGHQDIPDDIDSEEFSVELFRIGKAEDGVQCQRMTTSSGRTIQRILTPDGTSDWKKMLNEDDIQAIARPVVLECDADMYELMSDIIKSYDKAINITNFGQVVKYGKVILKCKFSSKYELEWEIPMVSFDNFIFQRSIEFPTSKEYINIQIVAHQSSYEKAGMAVSIWKASIPL